MSPAQPPEGPRGGAARRGQRLDRGILQLGLVSFLTDLSSEAVFSVFAVFFTTVAGASSALLGLVEGLADLSASSLNYLAGRLADGSGRRKPFALAGYGFSMLAKTILVLSSSIAGLAVFRVAERLGKRFRGPPRDAWLASLAAPSTRGFAFGVHKAMDKAGAVFGPLLAYAVLRWLGDSPDAYRTLFWLALVPAVLAVVVLARLPDQPGPAHARESMARNWQRLSPGFRRLLLPAGIFALSYYSIGFLLLRAEAAGFGAAQTVLLYALFNGVCVATAPGAGRLGDLVGRTRLVALGFAIYAGINLALVFATSTWAVIAAFAAYGVFYAIEDSQTRALIADLEPERRATAVGIYNFATGTLYLPASLLAGGLWALDPRLAFAAATALALLALAVLLARPPVARPSAAP